MRWSNSAEKLEGSQSLYECFSKGGPNNHLQHNLLGFSPGLLRQQLWWGWSGIYNKASSKGDL